MEELPWFSRTIFLRLSDDLVLSIKAPQLVGICCGVVVFTVTIATVVYLLFRSGSISRLMEEMQQNPRSASVPKGAGAKAAKKGEAGPPPQYDTRPELYEHLLEAAKTLPLRPSPPLLEGRYLEVRLLEPGDISVLIEASNGSAQYHESAYDPVTRIWGWLSLVPPSVFLQLSAKPSVENTAAAGGSGSSSCSTAKTTDDWPYSSEAAFAQHFGVAPVNGAHLVIIDTIVQKPVGMLSLVCNQPSNLVITLDNLWLTPAYQGHSRKFAHEALLLVLGWLFDTANYRRVVCEVDVRHAVMRKFIERCGFQSEGVLRKHKIISRRNRDTALYVLLNSDWTDAALVLKRHLGIETKVKGKEAATIETAPLLLPAPGAGDGKLKRG